ncbi:MAG: YdeI/OmpD-associated family protein [Flavobacteriales bacterium]
MAKKQKTRFEFEGEFIKIDNATFMQYVVVVPPDAFAQMPQKTNVRGKGKMNGAPFSLAVQKMKDGTRYFAANKALQKAGHLHLGAPVKIFFELVDPEEVELPEELLAVIEQDPDNGQLWFQLTPGRQRSLAHYIFSTKNIDLRIKRSMELLHRLSIGDIPLNHKKKE